FDPATSGGTAPVYVPPSESGSPPPIESQDQHTGTGDESSDPVGQIGKQAPDSVPVSANIEIPNNPEATTNPFGAPTVSGGPARSDDRYGNPTGQDYNAAPVQVNTQPAPENLNAGQMQQMQTSTSTSESLL